jgi:hypothetical protein
LLKSKMFAFAGYGPDDDVCGVVYAWLTGEVLAPKRDKKHFVSPLNDEADADVERVTMSVLGFLSRRSLHVAQRAAAKKSLPMLSAATHAGGFLDARVLARRVQSWLDHETPPDTEDMVLALLRLAPDHRAEALEKLPKDKAEWLQATRYALGDAKVKVGESSALWVAAARSRAPWRDDSAVESRHPNLGPDAAQAAQYKWREYMDGRVPIYRIDVEPRYPAKGNASQLPTVLFHLREKMFHSTEIGGHTAAPFAGSAQFGRLHWNPISLQVP